MIQNIIYGHYLFNQCLFYHCRSEQSYSHSINNQIYIIYHMSKQNYNQQIGHASTHNNKQHFVTLHLRKHYNSTNNDQHYHQYRNNSQAEDKYSTLQVKETTSQPKSHEIYFSKTKKYNYMKEIIDKYFDESQKDGSHAKYHTINPEDFLRQKKSISFMPKILRKDARDLREKKQTLMNMSQHLSLVSKRKNKIKINQKDKQQQQQDLLNNLSVNHESHNNQQQFPSQSHLLKNLSFSSTKNTGNLPPINELFQQKEEQTFNDSKYQSISFLNETSQQAQDYKEQKMMIVENEIYCIEVVSISGRINHKLKTYKDKGGEILNRQLKAIAMGIEPIWIQYKFNFKSLVAYPNKSLKELLFKIKGIDAQNKSFTIKPKKYHKKLVSNNYEQLRRVIIDFCEHMKRFEGKILNNKIHLGNLFIGRNENIRLGQWGFSSFRESHLIQQRQFENRLEPIVKSQNSWFVPPEYLAPQILKAILNNEDIDLMNQESASDIWSFGIAILQILTVIPVGVAQKCIVQGKSTARNGILYSIDMKKMLKRQQKLTYLVEKLIEEQFKEQRMDGRLLRMVLQCLEYSPEDRPTYQQIISILK